MISKLRHSLKKKTKVTNTTPRRVYHLEHQMDFLSFHTNPPLGNKIGVAVPRHTLVQLPGVVYSTFNDFATAYACCDTVIVFGLKYTTKEQDTLIEVK